MFEELSPTESRPLAWLKKSVLILLAAFLVLGIVSSHRAYVQVRSLELQAARRLQAGSQIQTTVVISGRTHVEVLLELR